MSLREGCRVSMWLVFISLTGFSPALSQTAISSARTQRPCRSSAVRRSPRLGPPTSARPSVTARGFERTLKGKVFRDGAGLYGASRRSSDFRRSIPTAMHSPSLRSSIRSLARLAM